MTIQPANGKIRVKVLVSVDESGAVRSAHFVYQGSSQYFARLALQASEKWKFTPATIGGKPEASRWFLEYKFSRKGTEVIPARAGDERR